MAQFTIASFPTVGKYYFEIPPKYLKLSHVEIPMIVALRTTGSAKFCNHTMRVNDTQLQTEFRY